MKFFRILILSLLLLPISGFSADALRDAPSFQVKEYHRVFPKGFKRDAEAMKAFFHEHRMEQGANSYGPIVGPVDISALVSLSRNQGICGSCWAYSLTKPLQSEYMIAGLPIPGLLDTSYLIGNCGGPVSEGGCGGGDFPAGKNFLNGLGPWGNGVDPSSGRCKSLPAVATAASMVMIGGDAGPSFQDMLAYISGVADGHKHLASVDVDASSGNWSGYGSGTFNACQGSASGIDHMINMYGGDCPSSKDANGVIQFDAQGRCINKDEVAYLENNWGEDWGVQASNGHGGYMKSLFYGKNGQKCNAIATDAAVFLIKYPAAIDGGWSDWSACSANSQSRTCTNPVPANGGAACVGVATQSCGVVSVAGMSVWAWLAIVVGIVALGGIVFVVVKKKN